MISSRLVALLALAASMSLSESRKLDVWAPPITSPDANTIWYAGVNYTITWDASNPPSSITNPVAQIYLVINGFINFQYKLAGNVQLTTGEANVICPQVSTGNSYQVVLIGDSGNDSPRFWIIDE